MTAGPGPGADTARALAAVVRRLQRTAARTRAEERNRALADLATGVLAERLGVPPVEAAAELARLARQAGVPAVTLAADIVGRTDGVPGVPGVPGAPAPERTAVPVPVPGLAVTPDLQRAAEAVLDQARAASGAAAVAVWRWLPDGALELAAHAGLPAAEATAWSRVPPGVGTPAERVRSSGAELWPGDRAASGPSVAAGSARAVLPLRDAGRCHGALEVVWPAPGPSLAPAERRSLHGLAGLCATLLDAADPPPPRDEQQAAVLDGLLSPALLLEPALRDGRVTDFTIVRAGEGFPDPLGRPGTSLEGASLLETYPAAGADGLFERLLRVHESGEALPAERVRLVFRDGERALPATVLLAAAPLGGRLLVSWQLETRADEPEQSALLRQAQRLARVAGFQEHPATGRILWSDGLAELYGLPPDSDPVPFLHLARHAHRDDQAAVRRLVDTVQHRHRSSSAVFRLARPDGTHRYTRIVAEPVLDDDGRLTGIRGAYHDVSVQHRTEIALGATRERLADSEQEAAVSEQLALRLQQAILPPAPPPLGASGLRAAVRYRPAARRDRVGGDWYDVLLLPDKRVLLAVGDVAGHGVEAATGMVALRHTLRGLAVTGAGPGRLLEWANTAAMREPGHVTATVVCVVFDPAGGELCWARAGHLPPIRLGPDRADVLPLPRGVLLGAVEEAAYEERTTHLAPGEVLLLYTDGLVERRDRSVEESVDQLIRSAGAPGPDLERYLDRLLELSPADTDDDTCLIAVQAE
ncbi:SpoIIE family protein phosphatase [Kitasatospora sp. RG8]|uniref:SpoIIE family protein phosphatase n=1 Tax=Kitasatospora sp. RG8 TaxID=2820815 RepID=UPI001AE080D7|nr:SpoIIE family protein phosphatase [Kitasatospora sp. RG8]MBP0449139.1 SpoIIE family protein phosphatase [Kitasatospora sp. RG8]